MCDQGVPFQLFISVREFAPRLDPVVEYRSFARGEKLTAVSQYIYDCYVPEIAQNWKAHAVLIQNSWDRVKESLATQYESLVVDFAVFDDHAWVIELNPFDEYTDDALFDWKLNKDLLNNGDDTPTVEGTTFVMKVVEKPGQQAKTSVDRWWKAILERALTSS
jgi:hypothetical protein